MIKISKLLRGLYLCTHDHCFSALSNITLVPSGHYLKVSLVIALVPLVIALVPPWSLP